MTTPTIITPKSRTERGHVDAILDPSGWRIEREPVKLFFVVTRNGWDGQEYVRSASGRVSVFKTWAGAQRAMRAAEKGRA